MTGERECILYMSLRFLESNHRTSLFVPLSPLSRVRLLTPTRGGLMLWPLPDADKRLRSSPIVESSAGSPYEISHLTVAEVLEY